MPDYSKNIIYLSQAQYQELITNETITVDGVTINYNPNDLYVTPQSEPILDVRVNGASITNNGIANISAPTPTVPGVVTINTAYSGLRMNGSRLEISYATSAQVKAGSTVEFWRNPIYPGNQHEAVFYGLSKVAGVDLASETVTVGTYPDASKGAIQTMLGVDALIAPAESSTMASQAYAINDLFLNDGKLYKATAAISEGAAFDSTSNCQVTSITAEMVRDVQINGTSVMNNGVANLPLITSTTPGIAKVDQYSAYGINVRPDGTLQVVTASDAQIKSGSAGNDRRPITPSNQHASVFYGLAKAAGSDLASVENVTVGTYPDAAKAAIRSMIGAENGDDLIKIQDTQPTETATKLWLPATAPSGVEVPTVTEMNTALAGKVSDVQVNGVSIVSNGVANISVATSNDYGVVKVANGYGIYLYDGKLRINEATSGVIKQGIDNDYPIVAKNQHESVFYGLAKAASDTTQSQSSNAVGTYTDDAKAAIKSMIGVNVDDVQVNGTSVVNNGVANIPIAGENTIGVVKVAYGSQGLYVHSTTNQLIISKASDANVKTGTEQMKPIVPYNQHMSVFYGLAKAAGDTTMSSSSNAVGTYTDSAKASIKAMLGIVDGSTGTVDISGAAPSITAVENTRYVCGEVSTLSFTPAASGICIVRFTSGSTATVLTVPNTVKFPEWFDSTELETNTIYEICVTDGVYGAVMLWAQ